MYYTYLVRAYYYDDDGYLDRTLDGADDWCPSSAHKEKVPMPYDSISMRFTDILQRSRELKGPIGYSMHYLRRT